MRKIVPFKKDIVFPNHLAEITSISLEHTLHLENNYIKGEFILTGEYKMTDTSINTESFDYNIPFEISVDNKYVLDDISLDIDDFYYEIVNNNTLSINIEVLIDNLEEKPLIDDIEEVKVERVITNIDDDRCIEEESIIFDNLNSDENYATYKVYIIRENDNIDDIIMKYNVTREELEMYNDLTEVKIGDKIIIPCNA